METTFGSGVPMVESNQLFEPVGKQQLDRQDFMTLFITQLQYQDPMKPMDSYEMASQLAQFSNMEATMKMSENMEKMLDYQTSQNNLQLLTLLDKDVQALGNEIAISDGEVSRAEFTLYEPAESCKVNVFDANGVLLDVIDLGTMQVGTFELSWDGKNARGDEMEDGLYRYSVQAADLEGSSVDVDYRITGKVTGVQFDSGQAMLTLDNQVAVKVADVVQVLDSTTE